MIKKLKGKVNDGFWPWSLRDHRFGPDHGSTEIDLPKYSLGVMAGCVLLISTYRRQKA